MAEAQEYHLADLYGGAMKVLIPKGFTNIGQIYPIPDNQEIFRSTKTKTNIVIELVERLQPGDYNLPQEDLARISTQTPGQYPVTHSETTIEDFKTVLCHIHDICAANKDKYEILDPPKPYPVLLIPAPAYTCQVLIRSKIRVAAPADGASPGSGSVIASGSVSGAGESGSATSSTSAAFTERETTGTCHFFLVRLAQFGTDILVHINVPHDDLEESGGPGAIAREELHAHQIMAEMMRSLGVLDYGLFGN
ncbi:hypothetical protein FQN57_006986 [Myotisia sp. PD_48]|nr:hypothetical protein FQN57_006986 [Myotisia sp. PD_48]